jgi:2-iminobutanoate/2-iminopropanoate deaminase
MTITRTTQLAGRPTAFPFSLAGDTGGVCFISGMPALGPDGTYQEGTVEEEVALAWHNVLEIAQAAGHTAQEIVYVQCVLGDIANYGALNSWWKSQFPDSANAPARFTFQAAALPFGCKVELQAVAGRAR